MINSYIGIIALTLVLSFIICLPVIWKYRVVLSAVNNGLIGVSLGLLLTSGASWLSIILLSLTQILHLFSSLRLAKKSSIYVDTRRRYLISTCWIMIFTGIFAVSGSVFDNGYLSVAQLLIGVGMLQFVIATIFVLHLRSLRHTTNIGPEQRTSKQKIKYPSLSVLVPARNETQDLHACLASILASDYPKLEVIVYDDCSQDNTAQIIKDFAHKGVRFIKGKPVYSSWLPKNRAYEQLLSEALGKYVVFCGVDVRLGPADLRIMTEQMVLNKGLNMVSVLPIRPVKYDRGYFLQPLRYYRELVFPRIFNKTPPVISTLWTAERTFILKNGGFSSVKKMIRPERYFARLAQEVDSYRFIIAAGYLDVYSVKSLGAQWNTAVRTRYPENASAPERVFISTLAYAVFLLGPGLLTCIGLVYGWPLEITGLSALAVLLLIYIQIRVSKLVSGTVSLYKIFLFPLSVILEIIVMNYSMWAYEFSQVYWKGRNICQPALKVSARLPKL